MVGGGEGVRGLRGFVGFFFLEEKFRVWGMFLFFLCV